MPVQLSRPSVDQYVLGPHLNHDARSVGIDSPECVKLRETLPAQEESAGRDIPTGQLVTKVLVSRGSPLESPASIGLALRALSLGNESTVQTGVCALAWTAAG